jgi:hypothetical protein
VVETVLACDQLAALDESEQVEGEAGADDAGLLQLERDGLCAGAGGDVDVGRRGVGRSGGGAGGSVDHIARDGSDQEREQQQRCEELQAGPFVRGWIAGCLLDLYYGERSCRGSNAG